MKMFLFTCVELLGDMVNITPTLDIWARTNTDFRNEIRLQDQNFCRFMAGDYLFGKILVIPGDFEQVRNPPDRDRYTLFHNFNITRAHQIAVREKIHISRAYARPLNLVPDIEWPILPNLSPKNYLPDPYVCLAPFAGHSAHPELGHERALTYIVWSEIIQCLSKKIQVVILGYIGSPWKLFKSHISPNPFVQYLNEDDLKLSLEYVFGENCRGFVGQNSGLMHCISGACQQLNRTYFPVLAFMTNVVPPAVHYPSGVPPDSLIIRHDWCGKLTFGQIETDLKKYMYLLQ